MNYLSAAANSAMGSLKLSNFSNNPSTTQGATVDQRDTSVITSEGFDPETKIFEFHELTAASKKPTNVRGDNWTYFQDKEGIGAHVTFQASKTKTGLIETQHADIRPGDTYNKAGDYSACVTNPGNDQDYDTSPNSGNDTVTSYVLTVDESKSAYSQDLPQQITHYGMQSDHAPRELHSNWFYPATRGIKVARIQRFHQPHIAIQDHPLIKTGDNLSLDDGTRLFVRDPNDPTLKGEHIIQLGNGTKNSTEMKNSID